MLNNCYTVRHSPVFRNPKSNVAVQHLSQIINETNGRLSPLQPKKIVGIKKNSTDHQLPLCDVPFQTNLFALNENDMSYSNRANIQTTRQFSRNQRTQSVYACNKENYVRSPTRSPFIKPVIQKECYTPIYSKSPIQRVQSPIIQHTIRQTNQKGFGSISPLRVQQRPKEPLSEMVDNLKQNILRDIQQVTQKYKEPQKYDEIKIQEFKKQQYLEQQAQLLQQQLEFIKSQQQKISQPKNNQESIAFLKSMESQNKSQIYNEQLSNFQSLKQDSNKLKQMQEIKKFTHDHQSIQQQLFDRAQQQNKYTQQIDQLQKLNNKVESIQRQQNYISDYLKPEEPIERSTSLFTKQVSSTQSELTKLKNLQLELMQNKPLFEQPKQSKIDFNFKQENIQPNFPSFTKQESIQKFSDYVLKQDNQSQKFQDLTYKQNDDPNQYLIKQNFKHENYQKNDNENYNFKQENIHKIEEFNFESFNFKNRQQDQQKFIQSKKLPAYLKAPKEIDEDGGNTISNISSIIPADYSAQQNKKINVSFESIIDQQQDFLKGTYCRNTFGPLQLETILRSPCQPEFDLNSSRIKKQYIKETHCDDENFQCVYKNDSQQCTAEKQESFIQTKQSIESKLENDNDNSIHSIHSIHSTNNKNNSFNRQNSKQNTVEKENQQNTQERQNTQEKQNSIIKSYEKYNTQEKLNTQEKFNTQERQRTSERQNSSQNIQPFQRDSEQRAKTHSSGKRYSGFKEQQQLDEKNNNSANSNNSNNSQQRYEQILQNIQSIKAQKVEIPNEQRVKESLKVNECQHISDFVIYTEQPQEIKKKTVTFNEQLIQECKTEKIANFSDFMKSNTLEMIEKPQEILEFSKLQPKGISFLQYKQQMES